MWNDVNVSVRMRANPVKQLIDKCRRKELISVTDKPILIGVTGSVCPGDLLAILGSSGAGQCTHTVAPMAQCVTVCVSYSLRRKRPEFRFESRSRPILRFSPEFLTGNGQLDNS